MNRKPSLVIWVVILLLLAFSAVNTYLILNRYTPTRQMVAEEVAKYAEQLSPIETNNVKVVEVKPQDGQDGADGRDGKDGQGIKGDKGDKGDKGEDGKTLQIMWGSDGKLLTRYTGDDVWQEVPKENNEVIN